MRTRAFDLAVCALVLPIALPLMAVLAIAVALDSPGPVLYRARRLGRDGRPFDMLKLRTMRHDAEGGPLTLPGDDRCTPLGAWLRRHRLDELPQLLNVLTGSMRIVGPRPESPELAAAHPDLFARVLAVPPGLTGPTQLAYADEGRLLAAAEDPVATYREVVLPAKLRLDLRYVEERSMAGDVACLMRTALLVVRGHRPAPPRQGVVLLAQASATVVMLAAMATTLALAAELAGR